jgi:hypothetical protein
VILAVTHAANKNFLSIVPSGGDSRRIASERFLKATGMTVSTSKIFFFENQYNCLSESAIDSLYACHSGGEADPDVQEAFIHRQKNYQLNVLESFNLFKAVTKINPLSRHDIMRKIGADHKDLISSGLLGKDVEVGPKRYTSLGSISLPVGTWQVIGSSNYQGAHGNPHYFHQLTTNPDSGSGSARGEDAFYGSIVPSTGAGSAATICFVVSLTVPTTYYLNANTLSVSAGVGGILGSITAIRLSSRNND